MMNTELPDELESLQNVFKKKIEELEKVYETILQYALKRAEKEKMDRLRNDLKG